MKPSLVAALAKHDSQGRESSTSSKLSDLNLPDIRGSSETLQPLCMLSNDSLIFEIMAEEKVENTEYTGFTIALKKESSGLLRLTRQESLRSLKPVKVVPKTLEDVKNSEDMKIEDSEKIVEFSGANVGRVVHIQPDPYSKPEDVWMGLEVTVSKNDVEKKYVLMTHGLGNWVIDDVNRADKLAIKDCDSGETIWKVDTAEVVRDEAKGPFVRLNIDKDNSVAFYPLKASAGQIKRFMTEYYASTPSAAKAELKAFIPEANEND